MQFHLDVGSQQFPTRTEQRLNSKKITGKMVSCAIYDHSLLFLLSYTINAWPNLLFLPGGNLHWLCQFLKMMERDLIKVSIIL